MIYFYINSDYSMSYGTTKKVDVDQSALSIADQWMNVKLTEYVFISRFTNYIPYKVDTPIDNRR